MKSSIFAKQLGWSLATFCLVVLSMSQWAAGHFVWLVPQEESGSRVQVYFSEGPEADNPKLLEKLSGIRVKAYRDDEKFEEVELQWSSDRQQLFASHPSSSAWQLSHTYGVFGKESKMLLKYHASTVPCGRPGMQSREVVHLPQSGYSVEPTFDGKTLTVAVTLNGKPATVQSVEFQSPNDHQSLKTDTSGKLTIASLKPGVYACRVQANDPSPGSHEGQEYQEVREYSTFSFIVPKLDGISKLNDDEDKTTALPQSITSFGAVTLQNKLYAFGGNLGSSHAYSNEDQFHQLIRLDSDVPNSWEVIAEGPSVQGNALVADGDSVILVGGFTAENKRGTPDRLVSQLKVERYDLNSNKWSPLPNLPEPRSSLDAMVLGRYLYVVGGWTLNGESKNSTWLESAWRLSLDKPDHWESIANPPFERRALALAAYQGKLFAIGGMNKSGETTTETCMYDPGTNAWSVVGSLVGKPMNGFGCTAVVVKNQLVVSTMDGSIQRFQPEKSQWEIIGQIDPGRFFHRALPWKEDAIALIGGANMEVGKFKQTLLLKVN